MSPSCHATFPHVSWDCCVLPFAQNCPLPPVIPSDGHSEGTGSGGGIKTLHLLLHFCRAMPCQRAGRAAFLSSSTLSRCFWKNLLQSESDTLFSNVINSLLACSLYFFPRHLFAREQNYLTAVQTDSVCHLLLSSCVQNCLPLASEHLHHSSP